MSHASNEGAFEALASGPATCGSLMVPCPWFREAADLAAERPAADLGVHLTLNSEWSQYRWGPVASASRVPSLIDSQGYLHRTALETLQSAKPEEVAIELRAQVEWALAAGIDVTHLDLKDTIAVEEVELPEGVECLLQPKLTLAIVLEPRKVTEEEEAEEAAAAEAAAEAAAAAATPSEGAPAPEPEAGGDTPAS